MIDARKISTDQEELEKSYEKLLKNSFFKDKTHITLDEILEFKHQMTEVMWSYEFFTYGPDENNNISVKQWLSSIVVCMQTNKVDRYLKQAKKVAKQFPEQTFITKEEYLTF